MSADKEAEELCVAAEHLNQEADQFEKMNKPSLEIVVFELRKQAMSLMHRVELLLRQDRIQAETKKHFENMEEQGKRLAREVKYRVSVLVHLRETGALNALAYEWGTLPLTLELYATREIAVHYLAEAIENEIKAPQKAPSVDRGKIRQGDRREIRKLAITGMLPAKIVELSGLSSNQVRHLIDMPFPADQLQRRVAVKALREKKRRNAIELKHLGWSTGDIASSIGLSTAFVDKVTNDAESTSL